MFARSLARHPQSRLANERLLQRAGCTAPVVAVRPRRYRSTTTTANVSTSSEPSSSAPLLASSSSSSSSSTGPIDQATSSEGATLPYLQHPLGVPEPPSTLRKSWRENTLELMDQDVRLARRKHIIKEATKGYFSDLNATRKLGGKTWIAPQTLIREDHALYFPDISGTSLKDKTTVHTTDLCKGKVSVVAMLSSAMSDEHVDSFTRQTNDSFLSTTTTTKTPHPHAHPYYQFIQINLQENPAKAFLVSLYLSSLRRNIPKELHPFYLLSRQNMEYLREPLGMNNKHIGFVYLVDENLKVRWAGGGLAIPQESESLMRCTKVLLDRMEKTAGSK